MQMPIETNSPRACSRPMCTRSNEWNDRKKTQRGSRIYHQW